MRQAKNVSLIDDFHARGERGIATSEVVTFPSVRWQKDPVGFAREALGIEPWEAQIKIIESIRDNRNSTVASGHKCGKSTALAIAALWFDASFPRARVFLTAVKATQIDEIIWKEIRRLYRGSRIPLGGELRELARSGLKHDDERQIWGATSRDGEGLAGISGPNILVLVDEASGIHDRFFEVLGSSLAGSGGTVRKCYISNPTRTTGEFYRSHTVNKAIFNCLTVSSEDTPNARGTGIVPGLAGPDWIAEKKIEYGEDSYLYNVRVRGRFVHDKDGKIISNDLISLAQQAWDEAPCEGQLQIGVDPAGDGIVGDESAIAARRGMKVARLTAYRGLSEDAIVEAVVATVREMRRPNEPIAKVAVDVEGGIGTRVFALLRAHLEQFPNEFELVPIRAGKKLWYSPTYDKIRDALWGECADWIKAGGAIPEDVKLSQELNAPTFIADKNQRYVATDKKTLRKALGRSTDRADAVCLAVYGWQGDSQISDEDESSVPAKKASDDSEDIEAIDPYEGASIWQTR